MKTQLQTLSSALLLTLGLGSCQALQSQFMPGESVTRVDDGLLSEVSAEEMNEIQTVRAARDAAKDDLALAERETRRAENREDLAKSEKKIAKLQLEDAKLRVKFSEAEGTLSELRTDRKQLEWADANMGTAELRFKLRGFQVDRAEAAESLGDADGAVFCTWSWDSSTASCAITCAIGDGTVFRGGACGRGTTVLRDLA